MAEIIVLYMTLSPEAYKHTFIRALCIGRVKTLVA